MSSSMPSLRRRKKKEDHRIRRRSFCRTSNVDYIVGENWGRSSMRRTASIRPNDITPFNLRDTVNINLRIPQALALASDKLGGCCDVRFIARGVRGIQWAVSLTFGRNP